MNDGYNEQQETEQQGGKVIDSGGYGCVFKPSLKCKNKTRRSKGSISKLMLKKYAKEEYELISTIKKILEKIPNYERYFLLKNIALCTPDLDSITKQDMTNFHTKCAKTFTYTEDLPTGTVKTDPDEIKNINNTDELLLLTMPFGGITLKKYLGEYPTSLKFINLHLYDLFIHGIVPMNRLKVYHLDIKQSNVLIKDRIRLIDWGISLILKKNGATAAEVLKELHSSLQFNKPYTIIILTPKFCDYYAERIAGAITYDAVYSVVYEYLKNFVHKRRGHYDTIIYYLMLIFRIDEPSAVKTVVDYITRVVFAYTRDGKFDWMAYMPVYLANVDIYGFVSIYYIFFEIGGMGGEVIGTTTDTITELVQLTLDNPERPISVKEVVKKLEAIDSAASSSA
jgi:serine/threonine protein kinase